MSISKVHIHTSSTDAFFVNSFVVEGATSVVLIDTQFVLSEAKSVLQKIDLLEKPLAAVFITHPHPDHFNGLATVLERYPGTSVYATRATIDGIQASAEQKRAYWTPIIGADYPQKFALPDVQLSDVENINIDGMDFRIKDLGAAESSDNTTIALPQIDSVVISDLVYNQVHPWLAEGRSQRWLAALKSAKADLNGARTLYAGHGKSGSASIIDEQYSYIENVRDMVADAIKKDGMLVEATKSELSKKILAFSADWPLDALIVPNLDSLAAELST